jgi:transcriptional regulator with XRE-family HTH domain
VYLPGTIYERIGDLRTSKGLSQKEFSELIGVAPSQLSRIEKGQIQHISSDILIKLASALDVSTDYILGLTTIKEPKSYDIGRLGLSEATVKALLNDSVDVQILNRVIEHKKFSYLMLMLKRYFNDDTASVIMERNEIIDFAT